VNDLIVLLAWDDFVNRENIKLPEDIDEMYDGTFLNSLADLPEGTYYERAPEYGERAWRIPGRKYSIVVLDCMNWLDPIGVEIEVDSFKYVTR